MPYEEAFTYRCNPFDITKIWSHKDYPLHEVGRLVLNRNPTNYHAEVEQSAFSPSRLIPGIEPSPDKMLQGRLFSYPDTQYHRLGPNFMQIPINCPYAARVANHQRDGWMCVTSNQGAAPNYEPNSFGGPSEVGPDAALAPFPVEGEARRYPYSHPNDDFVQAGNLYRDVMSAQDKTNLVNNIVDHMKHARHDIQVRQVKNFLRADREYGTRVAEGLKLDLSKL